MALPPPLEPLTAQAYLDWEATQPEKHEFYHGEVFAMGGASRQHVTVSGNIAAALDLALDGSPCRVYMADMKLQAATDHTYFYPDVLVTCDPIDHKADLFIQHPRLIVEVLSPSTAAYDRGVKFSAYRQIGSLQEYLLVDPELRRIELFRRVPSGVWELHDIAEGQPVNLTGLGVEIAWQRVFRNLD